MQATKIMATIKPGMPREFYRGMLEAGATLFRLNFNFYDGVKNEQDDRIITDLVECVRDINTRSLTYAGICADVRGPTFRTRLKHSLPVHKGAELVFSRTGDLSIDTETESFYAQLQCAAMPDKFMLVNHAQAVFRITDIDAARQEIKVVSVIDCTLENNKNVSFPAVCIRQNPLTSQDRLVIAYAKRKGIDYILQSYAQTGDDVAAMRAFIGADAPLIIAKVETAASCEPGNLRTIADNADAILIGRGHLADEISDRLTLPILEDTIIKNVAPTGKPVFIGTEVYYSMVNHHFPTRADMEGVYSIIRDGVAGVMLAGETTNSNNPARVVSTLSRQISLCETYLGTGATLRPVARDQHEALQMMLRKGVYPARNPDAS